MTEWQWKVILAIIRILLVSENGFHDCHNPEDIKLLKDALEMRIK